MARKEITQYFDDLDQLPLSEAELNIVHFSLDGSNYIIDLSAENAQKLRDTLRPFIAAGRKQVTMRPSGRRNSGAARNTKAREIRQWAINEGRSISLRGKIPSEVIEAYNRAHQ